MPASNPAQSAVAIYSYTTDLVYTSCEDFVRAIEHADGDMRLVFREKDLYPYQVLRDQYLIKNKVMGWGDTPEEAWRDAYKEMVNDPLRSLETHDLQSAQQALAQNMDDEDAVRDYTRIIELLNRALESS